jgi:hypothetical protein
VGTPGVAATDTSASRAIELTRALLAAVARTSAAIEVTDGARLDAGASYFS